MLIWLIWLGCREQLISLAIRRQCYTLEVPLAIALKGLAIALKGKTLRVENSAGVLHGRPLIPCARWDGFCGGGPVKRVRMLPVRDEAFDLTAQVGDRGVKNRGGSHAE